MEKIRAGLGQIQYLLDFLGVPEKILGPEDFYFHLNNFLAKTYGAKDISIWCLAKVKKGRSFKIYPRLEWFQGTKRQKIPSPHFIQMAKTWKKCKGIFGEVKTSKRSGTTLFISLGNYQGNDYYCYAKLPKQNVVFHQFWQHSIATIQKMFQWSISVAELNRVRDLANIDDVTGLFNQRKLALDLKRAMANHKKMKAEFSVLFIDIDHFKTVNDKHGHVIGTKILSEMARKMKKRLRQNDLVYRYGGDEFVMLLPNVGAVQSKKIAVRLLHAVADEPIIFDKKLKFFLSVSIGIALFPKDATSPEEILSMADRMMYEAKRGGRGRVCYAGEMLVRQKKPSA